MASAIVHLSEITESYAFPKTTELNVVFAEPGQNGPENSLSIDKAIIVSEIEEKSLEPLCPNSTEHSDSNPHIETIANTQENKDEENVSTNNHPTNVVKRKFRNILNSDSEEENTCAISVLNKSYFEQEPIGRSFESDEKDNCEISHSVATSKKSRRFIDSDSDENDITNVNSIDDDGTNNRNDRITGPPIEKPLKSKFRTIVDSDSTSDDEPKTPGSITIIGGNDTIDNSEKAHVAKKKNKQKISLIIDSESEDDHPALVLKKKELPSNRKRKSKPAKSANKSKISELIDTDSEDDHRSNGVEALPVNDQEGNDYWLTAKKTEKKRTGSLRASKDEAMRQIHSETQRLIRSSQLSLPYHRPKQRSLQDFLNRKTHILALPEGLTTAAKVRMSSEIVGKILEEKEKEAELFYKSSDSEDETITSGTPENVTAVEETTASGTVMKEISIEDTQRIIKNNVQDSHNKKDIIQQGTVDIGVPRKLFMNEPIDSLEGNESADKTIIADDEDFGDADLKKRVKETKDGLREGSVPRKLFAVRSNKEVENSGEKNVDISTIVVSDNTNKETCKGIQCKSDSVDEGIHLSTKNIESSPLNDADANDFTLKLPDSGLQDSYDEPDETGIDEPVEQTVESFNLSETPFVSNKEYAKLNKRAKFSKENDDFDVVSHVDKDSGEAVVHHVFGLPPPDTDEPGTNDSGTKKSSIKKEVLSKLSNVSPRLRGAPGMIIDLSEDVRPDKDGVKSLVDRFLRHSTVKKPTSISMPYTIHHIKKTANGIEVVKEVIPNKIVLNDDTSNTNLQKPGAKHEKLRNELKQKMAMKRGEEWKLKEQKQKDENNKDMEEKSDYEDDIHLLDEEFEGSTESEPELEDMPPEKKKKRKLRAFADEEAEVSGDEDESADEEVEDETSVIMDNDSETGDDLSDAEETTVDKTKRPSRIVRAFEDDSNSLPDEKSERDIERDGKALERTDTDVDMFAPENDDWLSDTEAELPPSQILPRDQADARSQLCKTPLTAVNILRFVSPITQLTALNSGTDSPKDGLASNDVSHESRRMTGFSEEHTPIATKESPIVCESDKRIGFQKKLFEDPAGTVNDDELMDLCSGKFTGMESGVRSSFDILGNLPSEKITESQLMGLCSGSFASQEPDEEKLENNENHNVDETSQDIRLTFDDEIERSFDLVGPKERKVETKKSRTYKIVSSSDDESDESDSKEKQKMFRKKKIQKLDLSDNESENDEDKYVDYDSEENEVMVPKRDLKKSAAEFFEAEAELSESEWGSADEDEKDLDKLEIEEGDNEEFDENQMRDQLGKLHMRQVQDDDQREVRMLQELLFDDGDLHTEGSGRQRQFKWKNIDNLGEDGNLDLNKTIGDENEDPIEGDESDWCKERIERAKFLEEKKKLSIDEGNDELADDSQVFKLGIKALKKSKTSQSSQKEFEPSITKPVVPRTVLDLMSSPALGPKNVHKAAKRGSFLARGDECLARLAVHIKQSESIVLPRTNPGQFVFRHISPSVQPETENGKNNLSKEESPTDVKGKKRKPAAGITPRSTKKQKLDITRSRKNKLF